MSGFLQRLAMRARGTSAAEGLPLVRPVPALYGSPGEPAPPTSMEEEPARASASAPAWEAPGSPAARSVPVEREPDRAAEARLEQPVDTPSRPADPQPARDAYRVEARGAVADAPATMPPPAAEEQPPPTVVHPAPVASRSERSAPRPLALPEVSPAAPRPQTLPPAAGLERLFEAIEDVPAVDRRAPAEQADWGRAAETPDAGPGSPAISIGRIDISVVPPAPRQAPARTRGFDRYAGVRRGLDR